MKTLLFVLIVTNAVSLSYIFSSDFAGACRELVDMQKAELAKEADAAEQERRFWSNNDKPIPLPEFKDRGLW